MVAKYFYSAARYLSTLEWVESSRELLFDITVTAGVLLLNQTLHIFAEARAGCLTTLYFTPAQPKSKLETAD